MKEEFLLGHVKPHFPFQNHNKLSPIVSDNPFREIGDLGNISTQLIPLPYIIDQKSKGCCRVELDGPLTIGRDMGRSELRIYEKR